jgi:hypothetical protein
MMERSMSGVNTRRPSLGSTLSLNRPQQPLRRQSVDVVSSVASHQSYGDMSWESADKTKTFFNKNPEAQACYNDPQKFLDDNGKEAYNSARRTLEGHVLEFVAFMKKRYETSATGSLSHKDIMKEAEEKQNPVAQIHHFLVSLEKKPL